MKFMLQLVPTVPASPVERERLRPIAHRTEKIQQMLDEMVELAQGEEADGAVRHQDHAGVYGVARRSAQKNRRARQ